MGLTELFILQSDFPWMLLPLPSVKDLLCRKSPGKRLPPSVFGSADFRLLCLQQATFSASGLKTALPL